jgi:hypothetical protein
VQQKAPKTAELGKILAPNWHQKRIFMQGDERKGAEIWHNLAPERSLLGRPYDLQRRLDRVISRLMHRETFLTKLTEIQQNVDFLLSQLQASEHDKFAAHLYRSRREFRSACERSGKSGKPIERSVIASFRIAETLGFKGDYRQWEHLLRIGD